MLKTLKLCTIIAMMLMLFGCGNSDKNQADSKIKEKSNQIMDKVRSKADPMVFVQGGIFQMGSNENDEEKPIHGVTVGSFYISKYEVTLLDWYDYLKDLEKKDFEKAKLYTNENVKYDKDGNLQIFSSITADDRNCPMHSLTWYDAVDYCNWISEKNGLENCYTVSGEKVECNFQADGYRLPTEAEWEYAARGGNSSKGYEYSGSNSVGDVAWYSSNSGSKTHPVGTKQPNELGLYDMSGNVWEWCWDLYGENYYKESAQENPLGSQSGSYRVIRGSSWLGKIRYCCVSCRLSHFPDSRAYFIGFRVVCLP
ncbi:MAG: formylglycine-generating enzyme family protein [Candidatus Delongbacteria bacterium]|nr:formylglycine-generating enzyme family protein [Candidatus Delongbacteria bacterium]MCG2760023.1 formylglycine-generating enzyme family protein [Candidatus Delongbacteria bacterium]